MAYSKVLEELIEAALADGVLTDKERAVLRKKAQQEGVDPDEIDVVVEGRLSKMKRQEDWLRPMPPQNSVNQKFGNVVKCPSCGAQVIGGSAICPECGYTFSNISASSSIEKLQAKLDEFNKRQEQRADKRGLLGTFLYATNITDVLKSKMDIVKNFPVPNTRADLLELLTMIQPMVNITGSRIGGKPQLGTEDLSYAYWLLFSNCINKARLSFSKDPDFSSYFAFHDQEIKKSRGVIGYFKCNPHTFTNLCLCLFLLIFLVGFILLLRY